jgi:NADPH:quinone reductase-like Zn-dependent oxidoreductase
MAKVVRFDETGGPEVLRIENVPRPEPGHGEIVLRVRSIAVSYGDALWRRGR